MSRERFNENLQKITELQRENREIAIQWWRDTYKERLAAQRSYFELDMIIAFFKWENSREKQSLCDLFAKETYLNYTNSPKELVDRAREYRLDIPEAMQDIICNACACRNCNICSDCEDCQKKDFYGFRTFCEE